MYPNYQTPNYRPSSKVKAAAALELRRRRDDGYRALPIDWQTRIPAIFQAYFWHPFSKPHEDVWEWANAINQESFPRPLAAFWSRGRGKSTVAESVAADLGIRKARNYCMYVSGTQDQADKHVQTIARMLEMDTVEAFVPEMGSPKRSKNGNQTWNRQIVSTATGYTVEAIGLNKAVRGQKIDWARPDLIIFDDVDEKHDTALTTKKKTEIITDSILPAGSQNCAVMFVQNLMHADSIATKLSKPAGSQGAAEYMMERIISGPFAAVDGLEYELRQKDDGLYSWIITAGRSLWEGFGLDICEKEINRFGPSSFLRESQHETDSDDPDALMCAEDFDRTRVSEFPDLDRVAVGVDPPGGATECGIICAGKARVGDEWHGYTLEDNSQPAGTRPEAWAVEVLKTYYRNRADVIFVETNFGGDMVISTLRQAKWVDAEGHMLVDGSKVHIEPVHASRGKAVRAEPVATAFQQGRGHHVGMFSTLEKEWRTFVPGAPSPNRLDAEVWVYIGLELTESGKLLLF